MKNEAISNISVLTLFPFDINPTFTWSTIIIATNQIFNSGPLKWHDIFNSSESKKGMAFSHHP